MLLAFGDPLFVKSGAKTFPEGTSCHLGAAHRLALSKSFDQTFSKVWPPAGPPEANRDTAKHSLLCDHQIPDDGFAFSYLVERFIHIVDGIAIRNQGFKSDTALVH